MWIFDNKIKQAKTKHHPKQKLKYQDILSYNLPALQNLLHWKSYDYKSNTLLTCTRRNMGDISMTIIFRDG